VNILVIGKDSYIGCKFAEYACKHHQVKLVDSHNNNWQAVDFTGFDVLLHCAGIAHNPNAPQKLYYEINRDLTLAVAQKAKNEGVSRFIFLSTMAVYGEINGEINLTTPAKPTTPYGTSKWQAEQALQKITDNHFSLCLIRPPMVYGPGCKGNFPRLVQLALWLRIFPDLPNRRSMIYIESLCAFLYGLINDETQKGIFLPQNRYYVSTVDLVRAINPRIRTIKIINPLFRFLAQRVSVFNKLFGDLYYTLQGNEPSYDHCDFVQSIQKSL